jgi:catechol 2,3-dioxygenase-like lactoylglutathione lyase family enzyme
MITGVHTMFYTSEPEALRAFFKDKLGLSATDVGEGWLIFDLPDAEMGCHPSETAENNVPSGTPHISFYCDDIDKTVGELRRKGVEFTGEIEDRGWGRATSFKVPGDFEIDLYQPHYSRNPAGR